MRTLAWGQRPLGARRCKECMQPIIMIDNRGRHLQGCLTQRAWSDSAGNAVKLSEADLAALHALRVSPMKKPRE